MILKEQQYVCTLAQTGSLQTAARQLNITSPALSLYISNLEHRLGAKLFERIGKRFSPTYAGELYVDTAKKMLDLKEGFDAVIGGITKNTLGRLRVAVQRYRSPYVSPQFIMKFSKLYPQFEIDLMEPSFPSMTEMLRSNAVDVFFGNTPIRQEEFDYSLILQDVLALMTSADHPIAEQAHPMAGSRFPWVDIDLIANERILMHEQGYSSRWLADQLFSDNHLTPKNVMIVEKTDTIMQMVSYGYGVALLPAGFAEYPRFKRPIRLFSVGKPQKTVEFAAVYRKREELPTYLRDAIEIMKEIMQSIHSS